LQQLSKFKKVKSLFGRYEEIPIDWEIKTFDELFEFLRTGTNSRDDLEESGDVQYIHYGDIHAKWDSVLDCDIEEIPWIDKSKVRELPFLKEGDLIIADASEDYEGSGASVLLKNIKHRKIVSGLHTIALRNIDESIFLDFRTYLNSIKFVKKQIVAYVTGISVYGLSKNNLKKIRIPLPPPKEQQEIASILSKVVELIQNTDQRIEETQRLKKGLMQRLLTKGIGHTKFENVHFYGKILSIPESWKVEELGTYTTKIGSGITPRGGSKVYLDEGIPLIRSQNVHFDGLKLDDVAYISEKIDEEMRNSRTQVGDVLLNITGASVGRCTFIPPYLSRGNVNQHVCIIRPNSGINSIFLSIYLSSNIGQNIIHRSYHGLSREGLTFSQIASFKLLLPTLEEQKKIAEMVNSVDSLIGTEIQNKQKVEYLRKGLMQQLLTGKIRVKV
jgi:type I restriction enzyme, S subunit